jgi:hypothetical protein
MSEPQSVFSQWENKSYPFRFSGRLHIRNLMGGTPKDQKVAEAWLKSKLGADRNDQIREIVAQIMAEQGVDVDTATELANAHKNLNGFRQDERGLYLEGRILKAALKEAISVSVASGDIKGRGWGATNKGLLAYFAEHAFILEEKMYLHLDGKPILEPEGIAQKFVHTWRGNGIQYEEYLTTAEVDFTLISDHPFTLKDWAFIWTKGQHQGIGASRSQGYGTYSLIKWDGLSLAAKKILKDEADATE